MGKSQCRGITKREGRGAGRGTRDGGSENRFGVRHCESRTPPCLTSSHYLAMLGTAHSVGCLAGPQQARGMDLDKRKRRRERPRGLLQAGAAHM